MLKNSLGSLGDQPNIRVTRFHLCDDLCKQEMTSSDIFAINA